jgi:hypothetical protein
MEPATKSLNVSFTEAELKRISDCAGVERVPPDAWIRRIASDIARRVIKARATDTDD